MLLFFLIVAAIPTFGAGGSDALQSPLSPVPAAQQKYPKIVLFSVSWCPHCKEAKEYFTHNNIPFINRDVELDPEAMELLQNKYKSTGVPVIVLGNDDKILKGFSKDVFEKAVRELQEKQKK
jgi:glutaredoxin-like YruB-family protein